MGRATEPRTIHPGSSPAVVRLLRETRGAQLVEYIVVVGAVALTTLVAFAAFGGRLQGKASAQGERVRTLTAAADGAPVAELAPPAVHAASRPKASLLRSFSSFFSTAAQAATPEVGALPPAPAPAAPATVTENADAAFSDFHGVTARKKGIGFWVTKEAGTPVAFGFTAGAAIDSDAATNVVSSRAAFVEGTHQYVDPHYRAGTTVKFIHEVPVLKDGKPVMENGKPVTRLVRRPIPANEIPYLALPPEIYMPRDRNGHFVPGTGPLGSVQVRPGDYVRVSYRGTTVYAIFVDAGPKNEVGEVSMYLAEALGMSPNPNGGGTDAKEVTYEILPGSGPAIPVEGQPGKLHEALVALTPEQIQEAGKKAFEAAAGKKWVLPKP